MNLAYIFILDYLSELPASFSTLASRESEIIFNKAPLGLPEECLLEKLWQMLKLGLIFVEPIKPIQSIRPQNKDTDDITQCRIGLTELGGEMWEREYMPNWEKYLSVAVAVDSPEVDVIEFESMHDDVLMSIRDELSSVIIRSSLNLVKPWNVLYWKQLDSGFHLKIEVPSESVPDTFFLSKRHQWHRPSPACCN